MINNPARELYNNMDIENIKPMEQEQGKGLLTKRTVSTVSSNASKEPAFRVAQHMSIIREQREMLKNG